LVVLSVVEDRARHGYEISKLIESRSERALTFNVASLYPMSTAWKPAAGFKDGEWKNLVNGGGGITALLRAAARYWQHSGKVGVSSPRRYDVSQVSTMPDWKQIVGERLAQLQFQSAAESEVFDEVADHLEDRYQDLLASGIPETEARDLTMELLNDSPRLVEALRGTRRPAARETPSESAHPLAFWFYDFRMAWRDVHQKPGFSILVVGLLALGISGNTAIFSTFNSLF
jgi:hypothetical protein